MTFEFFSVPRIVFGTGQFARIGELAAPLGSAALVVYNGGEDLPARLTTVLAQRNMRCVCCRQRGEPKVEDVDSGLALARSEKCDLVIGLGGGSAIDAAKAVAGLLTSGGSALDYMEVIGKGLKITRPAAPWIAIPITGGTGAEATRNAVIGSPEKQFKASLRSEHLLARVALVDPELAAAVPPHVTAASGMDALCQLIESYTSTNASLMTDPLAVQGIGLAARSLRRAYENGLDIAARSDMALAALLSGITLGNAGLGAVHGFAAPLGANFPIPHGVVCAALLPHIISVNIAALRANSPAHPILSRYAAIGRCLTSRPDLPDSSAIDAAIEQTASLARDLHIPPLKQFGLADAHIPSMVALARKSSSMRYNPIVLSDDSLSAALRGAIGGGAPILPGQP